MNNIKLPMPFLVTCAPLVASADFGDRFQFGLYGLVAGQTARLHPLFSQY